MATKLTKQTAWTKLQPKPLARGISKKPHGPTSAGLTSGRVAGYDLRTGTLGIRGESAAKLIEKIGEGFPYELVEKFRKLTDLPMEAIADLIRVPARTLNRRKQEGRLRPDESERVLRVARVVEKAVDLFEGQIDAAMRWLGAPQPALAGQTPLRFARTDVGAREVEDLIGRLEHGVFS